MPETKKYIEGLILYQHGFHGGTPDLFGLFIQDGKIVRQKLLENIPGGSTTQFTRYELIVDFDNLIGLEPSVTNFGNPLNGSYFLVFSAFLDYSNKLKVNHFLGICSVGGLATRLIFDKSLNSVKNFGSVCSRQDATLSSNLISFPNLQFGSANFESLVFNYSTPASCTSLTIKLALNTSVAEIRQVCLANFTVTPSTLYSIKIINATGPDTITNDEITVCRYIGSDIFASGLRCQLVPNTGSSTPSNVIWLFNSFFANGSG